MSGSTGRTTVGQLLTPAGQLTTLGDLPLNEALPPPDGRYLYVANGDADTISVVDVASHRRPPPSRSTAMVPSW